MSPEEIVARAFEVFAADLRQPPPLTMRGANAIDSHDWPTPFEATSDQVTASYLEGFAFWGLAYLDAPSWRHYLPALIQYVLVRPDDPALVADALVRSLRPPDHYPARLASLTPEQEAVVTAFLEHVAGGSGPEGLSADATDALDEWWRPGARSRPTPAAIAAARLEPTRYRRHVDASFRLDVPDTLTGSGARTIPEEARRVDVWGGYLRYDAHTVVAVNVSPLEARSLDQSVDARSSLFLEVPADRAIEVPGARRARRLDGPVRGGSPASPQVLTLVIAEGSHARVTLSVRAWPRPDVAGDVEHIVGSLSLAVDVPPALDPPP